MHWISCPVPPACRWFFIFLTHWIISLSIHLALKQQALGSGPADSDTHTVCQDSSPTLSALFGVPCLIYLTFPAITVSYYCFCFSFFPLCICSHTEIQERVKKTFSALHIDGWNWDLNCFWGLIWLNTLHIVKSRFLFEKIVCVQLHIFILLHSTVQIISFGKISTFIEKKAEILLLKQILKDIILNHWTRAFFQWYQVRINLQHLQKKEIKFHASVLPEYYKVKWILIGVKELTTNGGGVVRAVVGSSFIFRMLLCTVVWPYSYCMS